MDLREKLSDICREAGWDGPVVCPYDWRQPVDFVAQAWVAPRIWQHVGNKKKVRFAATWAMARNGLCWLSHFKA
jgi:hypothetical protein